MIYILGLDGVEHEFVEKWECSNLKQREYGKIEVRARAIVFDNYKPETVLDGETGFIVRDFDR